MRHTLVLLFLLIAGCSTGYHLNPSIEPPELVSLVPLPPYRGISSGRNLKLELLMCVTKEGTVRDVQCLNSSGNPEWDSLALQSVRGWRFTPPRRNGELTDLWIRQAVTVEFQEPVLMVLGEVSATNERSADSLFQLLDSGFDFGSLLTQSVPAVRDLQVSVLGTVDVTQYPPRVREALERLRVGEITRPVRVGDRYFIYKRLSKRTS